MTYAVLITCKAVASESGVNKRLIVQEDDKWWLVDDEWGWTCRSAGSRFYRDENLIPSDIVKFVTEEGAHEAMEGFPGHPWYIKIKSYEVVPVVPNMVIRQDGWKRQNESEGS